MPDVVYTETNSIENLVLNLDLPPNFFSHVRFSGFCFSHLRKAIYTSYGNEVVHNTTYSNC